MPPTIHENIPDSRGISLFEADPDLWRLMQVYLDRETCERVRPRLERMGSLAGGVWKSWR